MRLLLIKPKHIGDTLLLTPTIAAIKSRYPDAEIGVVVRRGCEGILAGCPHIQRILTVAPVERQDRRRNDFWRELAVLLRLWSVKFDFVFELGDGHRARFLALFNRAARRYSVKPVAPLKPREQRSFTAVSRFDWEKYHRVEKDFYSVSEFLPLTPLVPSLIFERKSTQPWAPAEPLQDFALMQIGTRQGFNTWSREGWLAVGEGLLRRFEHLVISCGPVAHERQDARWLQERLGARALNTAGVLTWPQVAGLLYRARLYVGPNTAAMHLAAACRCPVVALFGPSSEHFWYPWQVPYRIVSSPTYRPVEHPEECFLEIKTRSMSDIRPEEVITACEELMTECSELALSAPRPPPR